MHELAQRLRVQVIAALGLDYGCDVEVELDLEGTIVDATDHGRRLTPTEWQRLEDLRLPVGAYPDGSSSEEEGVDVLVYWDDDQAEAAGEGSA